MLKSNELELPDINHDFQAFKKAFINRLAERKSKEDFQCKLKTFEYAAKKPPQKSALVSGSIIRRKILILEDQKRSVLAWELHRNHQEEGKLSVRNPFKVDDGLINYNLDSEDEWAEENGEDLDGDMKGSDEEEDDSEEEDESGFIVDDGYLSLNEMVDSDVEQDEESKANLVERRKILIQRQREKIAQKSAQIMSLATVAEVILSPYDEKFTAKTLLPDLSFPLNPKWKEKTELIEEDADGKLDPNAINALLPKLIRHVHGSLDAKPKLIEDFLEMHPECSRNSVFRKFELFVKEKRSNDPRQRYYATDAAL